MRTIPIFVFGTLFSLVVAYASDKTQHRYAFTIGLIVWTSIGYIILLAQDGLSAGPKYMALFFIVSGAFSDLPLIMGWVSNAVGGHYKRSIASGMQAARTSQSFVFRHLPLMYKQGFGNCGGIIASNIFLVREAPKYPTGYGVAFALLWMSAICCTIFFFGLKWENRKRDRGERDWRLDEPDADNLGDDHPAFRFTT